MLTAMARVEWTRHSGDDVEAVVAMFVNREHPDSVRITPSRGDGGVDILHRRGATDRTDVVYQVKKYTGPLSSRQMDEVEKSLRRLMEDPRWERLNVSTWYLVTPWDPTPEAETWLQQLGAKHGLTAIWRGLGYVEQLAARYPDILDYYLYGGRNRNEEAYKTAMAIIGLERVEPGLDVQGLVNRIRLALRTLDTDPHYRYELRIGEGEFRNPPDSPDLVMSWMTRNVNDSRWVAVDVIARCAASIQERPIVVKGRFIADQGSDFESCLREFFHYGAPFTSPEGAYEGEIDAPGGLSGRIERARVAVTPTSENLGDNPQLHLEVLDPDGNVLAEVDVDRVDRSRGTTGVRVVLEEVHDVFMVEDRYNLNANTATRNLRFGDFTGQPVMVVQPALSFISHCHAPNVVRVSLRHTPPAQGRIDINWQFTLPEDMQHKLRETASVIDSLALIQQHTSAPIRVPNFDMVPPEQIMRWHLAARLLQGEDITVTYPEGGCFIVKFDTDIETPEGTFGIAVPLIVHVGEQQVDLGQVEAWLTDAMLVERVEHEGHTYYKFTTPDRTIRYHRNMDGSG